MLAIAHASTVTTWRREASDKHDHVATLALPHHQQKNYRGHGDADPAIVTDLCWNHNGQALVISSDTTQNQEPSIILMNTTSGTKMDAFRHDSSPSSTTVPTALSFGGKSRYLCIANDVGHVGLWDLKKKSRVRNYYPSGEPSLQTTMDDTFVYSLTTNALHVLWIKQGTLAVSVRASASASSQFTRMQLLPNRRIAVGTQGGDVEIHQIVRSPHEATTTSIVVTKLTTTPHSAAIQGMDLLNPQVLASCSADGVLCFTHLEHETTIQSVQLGEMNLTSLTVEGNRCAVGTDTGTVLVYDVRNFDEPLATLELEDAITTLKFAPEVMSSKVPSLQPPIASQSMLVSTPPRTAPTTPTRSPLLASPRLQQSMDELSEMVDDILTTATPNKLRPPPSIPEGDENVAPIFDMTAMTNAVDTLRDDVSASLRNLHVDMIRQFQAQNTHITSQLAKQTTMLETLVTENQYLRRENERLKARDQNLEN